MNFLLFFLGLIGLSHSAFWGDFRVKYDLNPVGHFNRQPKTETEAIEKGWQSIRFQDCLNDGKYSGYRYIVPGDNSLVLLFDVQGTIAGVQMLLPHDDIITPNNTFQFGQVPILNNETFDGQEYFVLTAYLVDPEIICTVGRDEADLINIGTGDGVWIQDGADASRLLEIPLMREEALNSGWSDNNCFPGMGTHSWYRMEDYAASNCEIQTPVFGLWNRAMELQGFGFSVPGLVANPHFENPPSLAIAAIAGRPAPPCLVEMNDLIGTTTMHVYFVDTPWLISC